MVTVALSNDVIERIVAENDLIFGPHGRWRPICRHFVRVRLANSSAIGYGGRAHTGSQLDSPFAGENVYVRQSPANSRALMKYPG
jgi:hypothetical protein